MKTIIKIFLLFVIALTLYLLFPRATTPLIYLSNEDRYALLKQDTPLNRVDIFILNIFDPKAGWIRLDRRTNKYNLYKAILYAPREKTRAMVMYGAETIDAFIMQISKQAHLNPQKLHKIYNKLAPFKEGSIVAQHYKIPYNTTEEATMNYMINKSYTLFEKMANKYKVLIGSTAFRQKVIIASILEKETQKYAQMPLIASVIYNRLKKGMRLQIDATLNYGKQAHTIVTPALIRKDNSLYNTYKHKGLPPIPLASFSKAALLAAFAPAKTNYLYFVKKKKGLHTFSTTYKKHQKKVTAYKERLAKRRAYNKRVKELLTKSAQSILTSRPYSIAPTLPRLPQLNSNN